MDVRHKIENQEIEYTLLPHIIYVSSLCDAAVELKRHTVWSVE